MEQYLTEAGMQEKRYDALYRKCASVFGLPDCAMWILYYLSSSDEELSQQDLIDKMLFPKQTINSSTIKLADQGMLELTPIPGTKNKKKITLTEQGRKLAEGTVVRIRRAEVQAVKDMGKQKIEQFLTLYREFYGCLEAAIKNEGIIGNESRV